MKSQKPIHFLHKVNEKWVINSTAKKHFEHSRKPVKVITITGQSRQGKSYFLNMLLGLDATSGFGVGHEVSSKTRGIWMWMKEEESSITIYLDTEGLFNAEDHWDTDTQIMLLSLILSSYLIVNIKASLDQNTIENLQIVTEFSKQIKDSNGKDQQIFEHSLPRLLFLIRDFSFNFGNFKGPKDYLLKTLGREEKILNDSSSIKEQRKITRNEVRHTFLNSFKEGMDCETLICPINDLERNLVKMDSDPTVIKQEFKEEMEKLASKIHKEAGFKKLVNSKNINQYTIVTGDGFIKMTESFIQQLNDGESFNIGSTFELVLESQTNHLISSTISKFEDVMKSLSTSFPMKRQDFYQHRDDLSLKLTKEASEKSSTHTRSKMLMRLKEEMEKISDHYYRMNVEKAEVECDRVWTILSGKFFSSIDPNSTEMYKTYEEAEEKASQLKQVFSLKITMNCPIEVVQKAELLKHQELELALNKLQSALKLSEIKIKMIDQERIHKEEEMLKQQEIARINDFLEEQKRSTATAKQEREMLIEQFEIEKKRFDEEREKSEKEFKERVSVIMKDNKEMGEKLMANQQKSYEEMEKMRKEHLEEMKLAQREFNERQEKCTSEMNARLDDLQQRNHELIITMNNNKRKSSGFSLPGIVDAFTKVVGVFYGLPK